MAYIVKNCPACKGYNVFGIDTDYCCYDKHDYCKNIKDCVIKQLINNCKERTQFCKNCVTQTCADCICGEYKHFEDILEYFEVNKLEENLEL